MDFSSSDEDTYSARSEAFGFPIQFRRSSNLLFAVCYINHSQSQISFRVVCFHSTTFCSYPLHRICASLAKLAVLYYCFRVNALIGDEVSDVIITVMGNQAEYLIGCKLEALRKKRF